MKTGLVYTRAWPSRRELQMEVFSYIEGFYNPRRRHSRLGNVSPDTHEKIYRESVPGVEVSGREGSLQLRLMRGLPTDTTAQVIIAGHTFTQNLRRGHYELAVDALPATRVTAAFAELTHAI